MSEPLFDVAGCRSSAKQSLDSRVPWIEHDRAVAWVDYYADAIRRCRRSAWVAGAACGLNLAFAGSAAYNAISQPHARLAWFVAGGINCAFAIWCGYLCGRDLENRRDAQECLDIWEATRKRLCEISRYGDVLTPGEG